MPLDLGNLKLYMGPTQLGAPDDLEATIIDFIKGAQKTLDIAVQEMEADKIAEAVISAKQRGVRVRVILEGLYLKEKGGLSDPWDGGGRNEKNRTVLNALLRADVKLISDLNPNTFHQKFVIRDAAENSSALLTGSTNFTPTGVANNLNHLVVLHGKRIAGIYSEEFEDCWTGTFGQKRSRHQDGPKSYRVANVRVKTLFSPDHAPELEIMKQMLKAKSSIDFAMFTFAKSSGIDDTLIALGAGKLKDKIRGVLDRGQANQDWSASHPLVKAKIDMYQIKNPCEVSKLHHKLMVLDKKVVIAGSFNYTGTANTMNDENIVVIGDFDEQKDAAKDGQKKLAAFALKEINRIIKKFGEKM